MTPDSKAKTVGIVSICIEDDALRMLHCTYEANILEPEQMLPFKNAIPKIDNSGLVLRSPMSIEHGGVEDWRAFSLKGKQTEIISKMNKFIGHLRANDKPIDGIGISCFGNINPSTKTMLYHITNGPRTGTADGKVDFNFAKELSKIGFNIEEQGISLCVDNDATAAAFGEAKYGAGAGENGTLVYIWLGHGVNAGVVLRHPGTETNVVYEPWRGQMHSELGHMYPRLHADDGDLITKLEDGLITTCTDHKTCVLGLASLRAINERLNSGMSADKVLEIYAYYIAQMCNVATLLLAPAKIVVGGYVLRDDYHDGPNRPPRPLFEEDALIEAVRKELRKLLGVFPVYTQIGFSDGIGGSKRDNLARFLVPAKLKGAEATLGMLESVRLRLMEARAVRASKSTAAEPQPRSS
jgi:predicted NBD/HSP70 family sugar kinase